MITDPIANLLTEIRNAQTAKHASTTTDASRKKARILDVLIDEGYVAGYEEASNAAGKPIFRINLRYCADGTAVIKQIKRLSKPGRRLYVGKDDLPRHKGGLGVIVVSTSQGVFSASEAQKRGVGGELICSVF